MAIVYVFTATDPNNVGAFPPSVRASTWFQKLEEYIIAHSETGPESSWVLGGDGGHGSVGVFSFNDENEFNSFVSTYTCTDAALLADIEAWKLAHSMTHQHAVYNLSNTNTSKLF
jgi:hypothetical protein